MTQKIEERPEVKRASTKTVLRFGQIKAPIGLFKTTGDVKGVEWDKAGPSGYPLRRVAKAEEGEAVKTSPTAVKPDLAPSAPGEYHERLVEEETGQVVEPADVRRGLFVDGSFVDLTAAIDRAEEASRLEEMVVVGFVDRRRVPRERIVGSYYLAGESSDYGPDPARVIRLLLEVLKKKERVAIVRWTKRKGSTLGVLTPAADGSMMVLELGFAEHFRAPNAKCLSHLQAEVSEGEIEKAGELIDALAAKRSDLDSIRDRRAQLEGELAERALSGEFDPSEFEVEEATEAEMEDLSALLVA